MIKIRDFTKKTDDDIRLAEKKALSAMVDAFADEMKKKLYQKHEEGWDGWDDESYEELFRKRLCEQILKQNRDYVDIANFAAMLWNMNSKPEE